MITICVAVYNRTFNLLNFLITSMNECRDKDQLALSVFDCKSTDVEDLKRDIKRMWDGKLIFKNESREFSKTYASNQAVSQSMTDKVFICDADMNLPIDFVEQYNKIVDRDTIWFPICYSLFKDKKREITKGNGWWRGEGHGMVGLLKENFSSLGGFKVNFVSWGGEDDDFFIRAHTRFKVVRNKCIGLFHNWHPPNEKWGGREIIESSYNLSEDARRSSKDIMLRSRSILLSYVAELILLGKNEEARAFLTKKFPYRRDRKWWKMWIGSWLPSWLLEHITQK